MQSQGMPAGLYVTALTNESPAYKAGIQPGDIITAIGGDKMQKMSDYIKKMEALHAEDAVKITVMRNGREAYTPLEFQATIGAR
jgi:S1-C subfamily serine protease